MSFWDIFVACLTGAGAMTLALAVVGLIVWGILYGGAYLLAWAVCAFENRGRR